MSIFLSVQSQISLTNPPCRPTSLFLSAFTSIFSSLHSQTSPADPPRRCPRWPTSIFLSVQSQISPTNPPRGSRSARRCAPQAYVKDQYLYKSKATLAPRMRPASPYLPCICAPHMHRRYSEISIYNFNTSPASTGLLTYYRSAPHFHLRIDPPRRS